jgi:signal transduction histidine kinase/PAS domain-containing protein
LTELTIDIEAALRDLADDPSAAALLGPSTAIVVWDAGIERILWASDAAGALRDAAAHADGTVRPDFLAKAKLRTLASGQAPRTAFRLDLLHLRTPGSGPATLVASRRIRIGPDDALVTAMVPGARSPAEANAAPGTSGEAPPAGVGASRIDILRNGGPRRFIWSADADGRITSVSRPLAEVVGRGRAEVVGRLWVELADGPIIDEDGAVAASLESRRHWAKVPILWRLEEPGWVVPVTFGGMPIFGPAGELEGFRGSGTCRTSEIRRERGFDDVAAPDRFEPAGGTAGAPIAAVLEVPTETLPPMSVPVLAPPTADQRTERSFGAMHARIGAQFGSARPIPLRVEVDAREPEPATPAAAAEPIAVPEPDGARPPLSHDERGALREIARALGARLEGDDEILDLADGRTAEIITLPAHRPREGEAARLLDRLPVGVAILRGATPLFANRSLRDALGYPAGRDLSDLEGLADLADRATRARRGNELRHRAEIAVGREDPGRCLGGARRMGRCAGVPALDRPASGRDPPAGSSLAGPALAGRRAMPCGRSRSHPSRSQRSTRMGASFPSGAPRPGSSESNRLPPGGRSVTDLLAAESHPDVVALLAGAGASEASEREVVVRFDGRTKLLVMRLARDGGAGAPRLLATWTEAGEAGRSKAGLRQAAEAALEGAARQGAFLARVSHEVRGPVNAIIGFAEIMLEERFGALGNERYRSYLKDIRVSGEHVIGLLDDLLAIASAASATAELSFTRLNLNEVVAETVAAVQAAAARERIVMRTSFGPGLPPVMADERSVRQIALNLLSNAMRYTGPGGQVIVSTARTDGGETALRVRDTGPE